jgi:hypothetical protein
MIDNFPHAFRFREKAKQLSLSCKDTALFPIPEFSIQRLISIHVARPTEHLFGSKVSDQKRTRMLF